MEIYLYNSKNNIFNLLSLFFLSLRLKNISLKWIVNIKFDFNMDDKWYFYAFTKYLFDNYVATIL